MPWPSKYNNLGGDVEKILRGALPMTSHKNPKAGKFDEACRRACTMVCLLVKQKRIQDKHSWPSCDLIPSGGTYFIYFHPLLTHFKQTPQIGLGGKHFLKKDTKMQGTKQSFVWIMGDDERLWVIRSQGHPALSGTRGDKWPGRRPHGEGASWLTTESSCGNRTITTSRDSSRKISPIKLSMKLRDYGAKVS